MKEYILRFLAKRLLKNRQTEVSIGYQHAQKVAILVNTQQKWPNIDQFINQLKLDKKQVSCLYFYKKNDPAEAGHEAFHPYDVGLFGALKSEILLKFSKPQYDYCFILNHQPHTYLDYLAVKLKCQTIIGFAYPEGNFLADLQVKPDHDKELNDLLRYTRQLS